MREYTACPNAKVVMSLGPTPGLEYTWYNSQTGGSIVLHGEKADKLKVRKCTTAGTCPALESGFSEDPTPGGNSTWWVEPVIKDYNWVLPRIQVVLKQGTDCALPVADADCITKGTLLYKEDFGGNDGEDDIKSTSIPQVIGYRYDMTLDNNSNHNDPVYVIAKQNPIPNAAHTWWSHYDHTFPGIKRGYFAAFDADLKEGQFYEVPISNLCKGTRLYFSAWLVSLCKNVPQKAAVAQLQFILEDKNSITGKTDTIAQFYTGPLKDDASANQWKHYGFDFELPEDKSDLVLKIINDGEGGDGNDFGIDDIEIYICTPHVNLLNSEKDVTICKGSTIELKAEFINNYTFYNNVYSYLLKNTGNPNNPSDWVPLLPPTDLGSCAVGAKKTFAEFTDAVNSTCYYRLAVSGSPTFSNYNCLAMSDIVKVNTKDCLALNTDRATVQKYWTVNINLLKNDVLDNNFFPRNFSLKDSIIKKPKAGEIYNTANDSIITYVNNGKMPHQIDTFQYRIRLGSQSATGNVFVYILDDSLGAAICMTPYGANNTYTPRLAHQPNVTFEWYNYDGSVTVPPIGNNFHYINPLNYSDRYRSDYMVIPKGTEGGDFPPGDYYLYREDNNEGNGTFPTRYDFLWTGAVDTLWENPRNWMLVYYKDRRYSYPVECPPSPCTSVVIPSSAERFPVLADSAYCGYLYMKDRAMIKNPHVLKNTIGHLEIELYLRPDSERDRFITWSAPIAGMNTGSYFYALHGGKNINDKNYNDIFINLFQQKNPDPSSSTEYQAEVSKMTSTIAATGQYLELGRAFNLKLVSTSANRDSVFRFSGGGQLFLSNKMQYNTTTKMYKLPVVSDIAISSIDPNAPILMQVVNPYMAYLDFGKFKEANPNSFTNNGYYTWDGDTKHGFTPVASYGNRYQAIGSLTAYASSGYIPPLKSFFVHIKGSEIKTDLNISPNMTEVNISPTSYSLRSSATTGGIMNITISQEDMQAYAALMYSAKATSLKDREDMPAVIYSDLALAVYTYSANNEPLAINANGYFNMAPVKLGIMAVKKGDVTLKFTNQETFGHNVILVDHVLNKRIFINTTPSYTFTVDKAGEVNNRFSLELTYTGSGITSTDDPAPAPDPALSIATTDEGIILHSPGSPIQSVIVHDILSRQVYSESNINTSEHFIPLPPRTIYIVTTKTEEGTIIKKIRSK
jgi:hypothetical protein